MFDQANPYAVGSLSVDERATFIRKTYFHVAGAIGVFAALTAIMLQIPAMVRLAGLMTHGYNWFIVLGAFMAVSWIADKWAHSATSLSKQYLGLGLFVVAEALIFLPIMVMATRYSSPDVLPQAGIATLALFAALTIVAFTTRKDFSFLGSFLKVGFIVALGAIAAGMIFKFDLGLLFSVAMVLLASGSILFNTSNMIHHYRTDQYVAASLGLFSSIALLFWYILQIFMSRD